MTEEPSRASLREEALHRHQRNFRRVLDACAYPGTVVRLEVDARPQAHGAAPAALGEALFEAVSLLVDQATTFCVVDAAHAEATSFIAGETHARPCDAPDADFLVVTSRACSSVARRAVLGARAGDLLAPERGASVIVGCEYVRSFGQSLVRRSAPAGARSSKPPADLCRVEVRGPGVDGANRFVVDRVDWALARAERADEFPCGIDVLLVDRDGFAVMVPRTSALALADGKAA
ncbi:phosphonate C-P lyase system protein PhnH [Adlercreutzia sp. ZJ473]|uniref:phosphonate C-P lyase system protein PhnH n=1 Tax=Adlercreutzia sp. ZJ473 TaxID=2722822 RepID=UPI00155269B6|nr:phosphonate C-P lyase system protein PhnH [Adlercreutzia sp. ZJ473]